MFAIMRFCYIGALFHILLLLGLRVLLTAQKWAEHSSCSTLGLFFFFTFCFMSFPILHLAES